jgi:hypothetical protein
MTAAKKPNLTSEDDYLASELKSTVKHKYLGGVVYTMAGARNRAQPHCWRDFRNAVWAADWKTVPAM